MNDTLGEVDITLVRIQFGGSVVNHQIAKMKHLPKFPAIQYYNRTIRTFVYIDVWYQKKVMSDDKRCVIVTWEVLQAFMHIAMMFALSIANVWGSIDNLVTLVLQPRASRVFCNSSREVN